VTPVDSIIAVDLAAVAVLFSFGMFALISKTNLIKMVIGIELMGKAVTLSFIVGGFISGSTGLSQSVVFTVIAIEAVVAALALALVIISKAAFKTIEVDKMNSIAASEEADK